MPPNTAASTAPAPLKQDWPEFTYADLRASRHTASQRLVAIHGNVYDVGTFISRHPGGAIINTAVGRDATILFETHHALVDKGIDSVRAVLRKYQVGVMQGEYTPVANFETPFARALIQAVREVTTGQNRRDSLYAYSSVIFFYASFALALWLAFTTQALWAAALLGITMSVGHVCGHAGNHWSLSSLDWVNAAVSATCTNLWGLREKYWEFSHLISHHCFNYTDRDYIMEQHVPMAYFRVRDSDPWRPRHAYQHYVYLSTFFTSFLLGAVRLDCAPWVFVAPLLAGLRRNADSPAPAPQFFASGSNTAEKDVAADQDGVGPDSFLVFDSWQSNAVSLLLSNVIWLPLFLSTWRRQESLLYAVLLNSVAFGTQAVIVTKNLLTQHMCEDIVLKPQYRAADCWYGLQVEASTSVDKAPFAMWLSYAISYQTEHHMFPSLNPRLLVAIQPVVERVSKEHGVRYHHLPSEAAALRSVYNQFKRLSVEKSE